MTIIGLCFSLFTFVWFIYSFLHHNTHELCFWGFMTVINLLYVIIRELPQVVQ